MADKQKYTVHDRQQVAGVQYGPGEYELEPNIAAALGATPLNKADKKAPAATPPKGFTDEEIEKIKALRGELPADFPSKPAFNQAGITTVEQVTGTAEDELLKIAGITKAVLAKVQERLRAMAAA